MAGQVQQPAVGTVAPWRRDGQQQPGMQQQHGEHSTGTDVPSITCRHSDDTHRLHVSTASWSTHSVTRKEKRLPSCIRRCNVNLNLSRITAGKAVMRCLGVGKSKLICHKSRKWQSPSQKQQDTSKLTPRPEVGSFLPNKRDQPLLQGFTVGSAAQSSDRWCRWVRQGQKRGCHNGKTEHGDMNKKAFWCFFPSHSPSVPQKPWKSHRTPKGKIKSCGFTTTLPAPPASFQKQNKQQHKSNQTKKTIKLLTPVEQWQRESHWGKILPPCTELLLLDFSAYLSKNVK